MNTIKFYNKDMPYYEFSNFYDAPILHEGNTWRTSEQFYQAQKFSHIPQFLEIIRNVDTPGKAFALGRQTKTQYSSKWFVNRSVYGDLKIDDAIDYSKRNNFTARSDWDAVKDDVMRFVVYQKFSQHKKLRDLLLSTGDAYLIEASPRDNYWGTNGSGKNMLGIILMETRNLLR